MPSRNSAVTRRSGSAVHLPVVRRRQPQQAAGAEQIGQHVADEHRRSCRPPRRAGHPATHRPSATASWSTAAVPRARPRSAISMVCRCAKYRPSTTIRTTPRVQLRAANRGHGQGVRPRGRRAGGDGDGRDQIGPDEHPARAGHPVQQHTGDRPEDQRRHHAAGHDQRDLVGAGVQDDHCGDRNGGAGQHAAEGRGDLRHRVQPQVRRARGPPLRSPRSSPATSRAARRGGRPPIGAITIAVSRPGQTALREFRHDYLR